jgi:hypothetical protein
VKKAAARPVTAREVAAARAFVERSGIVLQSGKGAVPSFAAYVAGEPIRGSWWAHPAAQRIFQLAEAVIDSGDVLVCKLVDGKVTYVHRRLWPALVKLSSRFERARLAKSWSEHTPTGAHVAKRLAFPKWVPPATLKAAARMTREQAEADLRAILAT